MRRIAIAAIGLLGSTAIASADISGNVVRIGVLTDLSGIFATAAGQGSVVAAQLAAEDFGGKIGDATIEIIAADHQNKPDVASAIVREWVDEKGVDAIADIPASSVALAVADLGAQNDAAVLVSTAGTSALTGEKCQPTTVHWTYDTVALANSAALGMVKAGGKRWFTIGADSAFGIDMEQRIKNIVEKNGAEMVGTIRHPYGVNDFSAFLLEAQSAKADVVAFLSGGADTSTAVKQAQEFQLPQSGVNILTPTMTIAEVDALGLEATQGLFIAEPFYWDMNEQTRAWSERFMERHNGAFPTMIHAGVYAAVTHYLKAVAAAMDDGGAKAVEQMKAMPTSDPLFGEGKIRVDGRKIHDYHLFKVKAPDASKSRGDYYELIQTVPGDDAFLPLSEGGCRLAAN